MKAMKIKKEDAILAVIDFQEKLMPAMKNNAELEETVIKLVKGMRVMGVPILVTQQYTKGLGGTTGRITEALTGSLFEGMVPECEFKPIEKVSFSAAGEAEFMKTLEASRRKTVIICGIEAHICVQQTALDLIDEGYNVFVVNDCVASRSNEDKKYAQRRMTESGAVGTTYEAVLYELLGGAKEVGFKQISAIVK